MVAVSIAYMIVQALIIFGVFDAPRVLWVLFSFTGTIGSLAYAAVLSGMHFTCASPDGYGLPDGVLATARALNDRIQPTAEVFYADPWVDMHNRMIEALVLMGKLPRAVVRPPLVKIPADEIARIRTALIAARLLAP